MEFWLFTGDKTPATAAEAKARGRAEHAPYILFGGVDAMTFVSDGPLRHRFLYLVQHQPEGSYLAVLERSPFWETGVRSVVERGSFHLVLGWPGGQP